MQQALTLVFVETKKGADSLEHWLCMNQFPATTVHGGRTRQVGKIALSACSLALSSKLESAFSHVYWDAFVVP